MSRGKQSVKKESGILVVKKRNNNNKKECKGIPFGLIASLAAPVLGEVAKPILKKVFGRGRPRKKRW